MLLIAIMLAHVSIIQMQNVLMDVLGVETTSGLDGQTIIQDRPFILDRYVRIIRTVFLGRLSVNVPRTLIDICFEKYNHILVLNQYDISKGPIAKLFGGDGFENPDMKFDFGTATDLKVCDLLTAIIFQRSCI